MRNLENFNNNINITKLRIKKNYLYNYIYLKEKKLIFNLSNKKSKI